MSPLNGNPHVCKRVYWFSENQTWLGHPHSHGGLMGKSIELENGDFPYVSLRESSCQTRRQPIFGMIHIDSPDFWQTLGLRSTSHRCTGHT
jgi:hypothetical protein